MHWTVAAPFIHNPDVDGDWLIPYIPGDRHHFSIIPHSEPLANWHNQSLSVTSYRQWLKYLDQAKDAVHQTRGGVITVFPQLASAVGIHQQLARKQIPIVAWLFNVGICYPGIRRRLAQISLKNVSHFVVHTRRECEIYSKWLGFPKERFEFIPYQSAEIPVIYEENDVEPFIVAIGSAHRDFPTLFKVVEKLKLPTVVASGPRSLAGLSIPSQVQTPFGIGKKECLRLAQEARINVIPLRPNELVTAAGQVTIVEAMRMGRAIIATRCNGAEDYIIHGETGLLVEPESSDDLRQAIEMLWNDEALRNRLGQAARHYASKHFSDEAVGRSLGKILDHLADSYPYQTPP
ncbi:glycosyltransferase [Leptolyngbyaceae cyanobacterium JSC-12]|nr:glycosyltransferase [Leptolyngbyaceae cyanobacterium JSC-12]